MKKKNTINPSLTQCLRSIENSTSPSDSPNSVCQNA